MVHPLRSSYLLDLVLLIKKRKLTSGVPWKVYPKSFFEFRLCRDIPEVADTIFLLKPCSHVHDRYFQFRSVHKSEISGLYSYFQNVKRLLFPISTIKVIISLDKASKDWAREKLPAKENSLNRFPCTLFSKNR